MSKTKTSDAPNPKTKSPVKLEAHVKHMAAAAAAHVKKFGLHPKLILLAILGAIAYAESGTGTSLAMLYMIAENGKKSGRADGNVYMRNGRIRGMAIPRLVQNGYTSAVRNAFSQFSAGFRALSQAQQDAWNNTAGFFKSDRFARQIEVKGKALYQMLNQNLFDVGVAPIVAPPVAGAVNGITSLSIVVDDSANTFVLTFAPDPTDANVNHKIFATAPLGAGINRPGKSLYRQIGVIDQLEPSGLDIYADYLVKFGNPVTGQKVFLKLVPVNKTTGQAGISIIATTTVVA